MMRMRAAALLTALVMTVTLGAGPARAAETTTAAATAAAETTAAAAAETTASSEAKHTQYPLTITTYNYEQQKCKYTFNKAPEKVWVQNQNNIELMLALGLGDRIVGACGMDGEVRSDLKADFDKLNFYENMPSKEEVIALEPDFILGWYSTFSDDRLGDVDFWQDRGIGTYMSLNSAAQGDATEHPRTVQNEMQDILTIGQIFDVQDKAQSFVDELQSEIDQIESYLTNNDKLSVAVLEDEGDSYRVYGADTLGGDVAKCGGAELVVGQHGENDNISAEDLIDVNPDAIFMVWYNGYTVNDKDYASEDCTKLITDKDAFQSLDAVKNNRVFAINLEEVYCSGLRTADGVRDFAEHLYPDLKLK